MNNGLDLIVPMQVQALCVGTSDAAGEDFWLPAMADFSTLPYVDNGQQKNRRPYTNLDVISNNGPFSGETKLPAGVHLHWALPAGLTRGQQQPDGSLLYPNVPNRWLVTRVVQRNKTSTTAGSITTSTKSWVIESDRLNLHSVAPSGLEQPTVPTDPNVPGQNFRFIGQAFPAESWSENPQAEHFADLTAAGYGEASFAAYYPNCCTVFGFMDVPSGAEYNYNYDSLSYHVCGWYSDASKDPNASGIVSGENPFNWVFENQFNTTVNNTLCSGIVDNVVWNPGRTYLSDGNPALSVALGASAQEAVSALMANQGETDPDMTETILNALQFGLLTDAGTINGSIQNFQERVHAAGFSNYNAGITWQVSKKVRAGTDDSYEGEITLPEPIAQDLNTLNLQQSQLNELKETLASKRSQLFADWYKYLTVEYDTQRTPPYVRVQGQGIREYLLAQAEAISELQTRVAEGGVLQQGINSLVAFITGMLDDQYELTNDTASARYWQAANPFIVLQGADILPVSRVGEGELACRIFQNLVLEIMIGANAVQSGQPSIYERFCDSSTITFPADVPAFLSMVLNDAVLTAPSLQPAIAAKFCVSYPQTHSNQQLNFTATLSVLQTSLPLFMAGATTPQAAYVCPNYIPAVAPDALSIFTWTTTPWLPVMLQYEVQFSPVEYLSPGTAYDPDFILENFRLIPEDDNIELEYVQSAPAQDQLYKGSILLSADAQVSLAESIAQFSAQSITPDPDLEEVLTLVSDMPLLAQEFSGLTQAMLMRQQSLQMKVADPLANTFDQPFVANIAAAVGAESAYSPEPNFSFNPIRTGSFSIVALRLIDAFGRFKDKQLAAPALVAKGLLPPSQLNAAAGTAFLPPRITQPSRLLFRWLSADYDTVESNSHPASSPVIGWVVPDYPDNSLFIYNADGTPLGELALAADNASVLWFAAPGGAFPIGTEMQTVMENQLPWLRNFAFGIYNNGDPALLRSMLSSMSSTALQTLPAGSSNNTAGTLAGQPLAITRASLRLDLAGDAAANESWQAFANSLLPDGGTDSAAFTSVKFPVKLGMQSNFNDGLLGYWIEEDSRINFTKFNTSSSPDSTLTLTADNTSRSTKTVMMLVDPQGEVHATTGILPVKSIAIPSDQYGAALNSLSVTFLTAPVLSGSNTSEISIPLPKTHNGHWAWVNVADGEWQFQNFSDTVQNSTQGALDYTPQQLLEGWLRLRDPEN
jgi:hypothetical protein